MATLTPEQVDLLLNNLSTDSAYYGRFQSDPSSAVLELGLPQWLADCSSNISELASQATISSTRTALTSDLTAELLQSVPGLDAGTSAKPSR